jgi:hypothetical protein
VRCALTVVAAVATFITVVAAGPVPERLPDDEFWRMATGFAERPGTFSSDNLLSNERWLQSVVPDLVRLARPGGIYLGVGPEQNFTYITALRPGLSFIFDIRRGNFDLHLMYKALFELSEDRADFLARLFCRERPDGLTAASTVGELFEAYARAETSNQLWAKNVRAVINHLTKTHRFVLSADDVLRLQHIYRAFHVYGPALQYSSTRNVGRRTGEPTYAELMTATDRNGDLRGYLASEESFALMKRLETENRIVPIIGNFIGTKAIRAVAEYLRAHGATVTAFYVSNVEEYLRQDGTWPRFCANVASLPLDEGSLFIRSSRVGTRDFGFELASELTPILPDVKPCLPD